MCHIERFLNNSSGRLNITSFILIFFLFFFLNKINQNKEESLGTITTTIIKVIRWIKLKDGEKVSEQHLKAAAADPPLPPPALQPAHLAQWAPMRGKPSIQVTCSCLQSTCEHRSVALWVSWRSEHGGIGQREHQSSGFSLGQTTSGRWAPAGLRGGHFHHA